MSISMNSVLHSLFGLALAQLIMISSVSAIGSGALEVKTLQGAKVQVHPRELLRALTNLRSELVRSDAPFLNGDGSIQFNNPEVFYDGRWQFMGRDRYFDDVTPRGACKLLLGGSAWLGRFEYVLVGKPVEAVSLTMSGLVQNPQAPPRAILQSVTCKPI